MRAPGKRNGRGSAQRQAGPGQAGSGRPLREADNPRSPVARFGHDKPLKLDAGVELSPFQIAYQTYGTLNAQRSNAILVCHALTGDQHVNNVHPVTGKAGLVGLHHRAGQADRHRALLRDLPERGRRVHGDDRARPRPIRRPASRGVWISRSSPSATWCARRRCCSTISASSSCSRSRAARWAGCRCCNGRRAIRSASFRRCRSRPRRAIRRRTSRSTRSAVRP